MYNKKLNQVKNCYSAPLVSAHALYHTVTEDIPLWGATSLILVHHDYATAFLWLTTNVSSTHKEITQTWFSVKLKQCSSRQWLHRPLPLTFIIQNSRFKSPDTMAQESDFNSQAMVFVLKKQCNVRHAGIWLHAKSQQAHS
jgi:hypothetical protein